MRPTARGRCRPSCPRTASISDKQRQSLRRVHLAPPRQPPRADHRRHRHRQDRDAAGPGRGLLRPGRSGVLRRRERRPFRHRGGRRSRSPGSRPATRRSATRRTSQAYPVIFWDLFGEQGPADPRDGFRDGAAAAVPPDGSERGAGRRAQYRLQDRRRRKASAHRSQGHAGRCSQNLATRADTLTTKYGNITKASVGSIQRSLLVLRAARRRAFLRRAGAQNQGPDADGARWARLYQRALGRAG